MNDLVNLEYESWIGSLISKKSNKPFKGGSKIVRIISITTNTYSNKKAFEVSDGSVVDCHQCKLE